MTDDVRRLLCLHEMAASHGTGLKPELAALLRAEAAAEAQAVARGAIPLGAARHSAGPTHQYATKAQLDAAGVTVLNKKYRRGARLPVTAPADMTGQRALGHPGHSGSEVTGASGRDHGGNDE